MADNGAFIKMSVYYADDQKTISSNNINVLGERIILLGEDFELLPHQAIVDVVGYLQDGVVFMSGKISLSTQSQINFDIIRSNDKQERRNYLKVKIQMNTKLLRAFSMGRQKKFYALNTPLQTRDISLGGIAFYTDSVLFRKQRINIDLNLLKPGFIVEAEVLRKERGPFRGGFRFKYGCRFLDVSGEEERVLCEFVFRTQLENHRRLMQGREEMK